MYHICRFSCFFLLLLCCGTRTFAQASSPSQPLLSMQPPAYLSPEAASLGRYGEIPVSEYTGVPEISIPLHTVSIGDLSLPLALTYHASGIKVAQEATWVGLGWDLQAGGCINRIVSGCLDGLYSTNTAQADWERFFALHSAPYQTFGDNARWGGVERNPSSPYKISIYQDLLYGVGEPDLFRACFCGHTLTFIIHPSIRQPVIVGEDKTGYKVESLDSNHNSWRITDKEGIRYYFELDGTERTSAVDDSHITSWFITRMEHPQRGTVRLEYETQGNLDMKLHPSLGQDFREAEYGCILLSSGNSSAGSPSASLLGRHDHYSYQNALLSKKYLKSIVTDMERVDFHKSSRNDIGGYSRKLDSLTVTSLISGKRVGKVSFSYGYFEAASTGGDYMEKETDGKTFRSKRLKLERMDTDGKLYSFAYNPEPLPFKTSFATDFWGYYNGISNRSFLCSATLKEQVAGGNVRIPGDANRYADSEKMQAGMLACITWPTAGYTEFKYEPHTFEDTATWCPLADKVISVTRDTVVWAFDCRTTHAEAFQYFALEKPVTATLEFVVSSPFHSLPDLSEAYARLCTIDGTGFNREYRIPVSESAPDRHSYTFSEQLELPAGHYFATASFPKDKYVSTDYSSICQLSVKFRSSSVPSFVSEGISYGGGLRVASISRHDSDGKLVSEKVYDYSGDGKATSGRLLLPLPKAKADRLYIGSWHEGGFLDPTDADSYCLESWNSYTLSSSVRLPVSTLLSGVCVGYDRVTVSERCGNERNGSVTSWFHNAPATAYGDIYVFENHLNGKMKKQLVKDSSGREVKLKEWGWQSTDARKLMLNAYAIDLAPGIPDCPYFKDLDRYRIYGYPFYTDWVKLLNESTTEYFYEGTEGRQVKSRTEYSYNAKNRLPSSILKTGSKTGEMFNLIVRYADHFAGTAAYDSLLSLNMLSTPVEVVEQRNGTDLLRTRNEYSLFGSVPRPSAVSVAKGSNAYETRLRLTRYDAYGNLLEQVRPDGVTVSRIWSYTNRYPVCLVEGMDYDSVVNALTPARISAINSGAYNALQLRELHTLLPQGMVRSTAYEPILGISGEIRPNGYAVAYGYDSCGRLSEMRETDSGSLIERYDYNYQPR